MATVKASSTNSINRNFLTDCNLTYAMLLMGGRGKLPILMRLEKGKRRFGELKKAIPNITERMLTLQLRELERDGLVSRTVYAEVPPRVEYELTGMGKELIPVCLQLHAWGAKHKLEHIGAESTLPQ
jgi:DNA-binding HxlR family transcriptional regulator